MYPPASFKVRKKRNSGPSLPHPSFRPRPRSRFSRSSRDVFLTLLGVVVVYLLYSSLWGGSRGRARHDLESVRLERHMNHGARKSWPSAKSSFDWSAIKFEFPPTEKETKTRLPLGAGGKADGADGGNPPKSSPLPRIQHDFKPETALAGKAREARRDKVRALFVKNWESYRRLAWMRDALLPLSGAGKDQFSGWAATLVDSLDTLWIMGLRTEFDEAVDAVAGIDFGQSTLDRVNMFETNIRYLGGLMAAYDLSRRSVLLSKAVEVGDMLYAGFNTRSRWPVDFFDFDRSKQGLELEVEEGVVVASPGTLLLEFTRLSQLTGDAKYYAAIAPIADLFYEAQGRTNLPGVWPQWIRMRDPPDLASGWAFTLGGGADSAFEYMVKMHAMLNGREHKYALMSAGWMDAANEHMLFRPMLPNGEDVLLAGNVNAHQRGNYELDPETEHLSCFLGGTYAVGGRILGREDLVDVGAKLAHGCAYTYRAMPTGMGPERFNTIACPKRSSCRWSAARWDEGKSQRTEYRETLPLGFTTAKDARYILRPEAIESVFVLWRATGRAEFVDTAWHMFEAIANGTATKYANAAVMDVTARERPLVQEDYMESFWLAETLKYFYLVFSPPDLISLDEFVLNTEAHPFRRPA